MDPNATLSRMREIVKEALEMEQLRIFDSTEPELIELVELVAALDEWMTRGGFKPTAWSTPPA